MKGRVVHPLAEPEGHVQKYYPPTWGYEYEYDTPTSRRRTKAAPLQEPLWVLGDIQVMLFLLNYTAFSSNWCPFLHFTLNLYMQRHSVTIFDSKFLLPIIRNLCYLRSFVPLGFTFEHDYRNWRFFDKSVKNI